MQKKPLILFLQDSSSPLLLAIIIIFAAHLTLKEIIGRGLLSENLYFEFTFIPANPKQDEENYLMIRALLSNVLMISLNVTLRVKHKPRCFISPQTVHCFTPSLKIWHQNLSQTPLSWTVQIPRPLQWGFHVSKNGAGKFWAVLSPLCNG